MTGEVLSCLYSYREPGGYSGTDFLGLPYFGGGNTKLPLPASTVTAARAACALPTGGATLPSTYAEMAKRLVGAWFVCPSAQPPGPAPGPPYDGITLNPDGGYEWLAAQGDHFVKVTDCSNSGLWGLDPAQAVQLNLFGDAGQYISLVQGFSTAPTISVAMSSDFGTATSWVQVQ
jgi:hypothetical protein